MFKVIFFLVATLASADIDEEKFENDYNETTESSFVASKNLADVQTIFKVIGFTTLKDDYDVVKTAKEEDTTVLAEKKEEPIYHANSELEHYFTFSEQLESMFRFNLHEKLILQLPIKAAISHGISSDALKNLALPNTIDAKLSRRMRVDLGALVSFSPLECLKFGLRGAIDDKDGYFFSINNRLYSNDDNQDGIISYDAFAMGGLAFVQTKFSPLSWMSIEPEMRLAYVAKATPVMKTIKLTDRMVVLYSILSPVKFEYRPLEEITLKSQLTPKITFEANSIFRLDVKTKFEIEYSIMDIAKLSLPVFLSLESKNSATSSDLSTLVNLEVLPEINVDFALFKSLYFIAQVDLDYKYGLYRSDSSTDIFPIRLNWHCGIRFDSGI